MTTKHESQENDASSQKPRADAPDGASGEPSSFWRTGFTPTARTVGLLLATLFAGILIVVILLLSLPPLLEGLGI